MKQKKWKQTTKNKREKKNWKSSLTLTKFMIGEGICQAVRCQSMGQSGKGADALKFAIVYDAQGLLQLRFCHDDRKKELDIDHKWLTKPLATEKWRERIKKEKGKTSETQGAEQTKI